LPRFHDVFFRFILLHVLCYKVLMILVRATVNDLRVLLVLFIIYILFSYIYTFINKVSL